MDLPRMVYVGVAVYPWCSPKGLVRAQCTGTGVGCKVLVRFVSHTCDDPKIIHRIGGYKYSNLPLVVAAI